MSRRPGLSPRLPVLQWHRVEAAPEDAVVYMQIGPQLGRQRRIPGGVQWEPFPPGRYVQQTTREELTIMPTREYHIRLDAVQPDATVDSWEVTATMSWSGLSTGQELGVLEDLHAQQGKYLDRAKEVAAAKGITPISTDPGTPLTPTPPAASPDTGHEAAWTPTPASL